MRKIEYKVVVKDEGNGIVSLRLKRVRRNIWMLCLVLGAVAMTILCATGAVVTHDTALRVLDIIGVVAWALTGVGYTYQWRNWE